MPIEDIDEDDDYVTPITPPPTLSSKAAGGVFDPFGDGGGGGPSNQTAHQGGSTKHVKQASTNEFDDFFSSPGPTASKPAQWGTSSSSQQQQSLSNGNALQQPSKQNNNDFIDFSKGSKSVQSHRNTDLGAEDLVNKLNLAAKGIHIRSQPTLSEMGTTNTTSNTDILTNPALLRRMSHYEVLGIVNPAYADEEDISRHYKKKALALHPDKFLTREGRPQTENEEALFKAIVRAYEVLSDAPRRKKYDEDVAYARRAGIPIEDINSDTATMGGGGGGGGPPPTATCSANGVSPQYADTTPAHPHPTPAAAFDNGNLWDAKKPSAAKTSDLDDLFAPSHPSSTSHGGAGTPHQSNGSASHQQPAWGGGSAAAPSKSTTGGGGSGYGGKQSTDIDDLFS